MKINILNMCDTCVCSEVCKMKDERELITRRIMDSHAIDTNESFIMDLSCSYYASWKVCAPYGKEEPQYEN